MKTHRGGNDHDGGQKGRMDSIFIAIEWRLMGRRRSNRTSTSEPSSTGGTETGSGLPEMGANYTGCLPQPHSRDEYVD
jgi:hypothetical protein